MAEEKSRLDKFRDLYLPTVREYEKKLGDTLSYYAGPELTKLGRGIRSLLPFQNLPDATEFIQDPSLKNFGQLASDTGITVAELTPFGYLASRSATLPGKVAQEITPGVKTINEIIDKPIKKTDNILKKTRSKEDILDELSVTDHSPEQWQKALSELGQPGFRKDDLIYLWEKKTGEKWNKGNIFKVMSKRTGTFTDEGPGLTDPGAAARIQQGINFKNAIDEIMAIDPDGVNFSAAWKQVHPNKVKSIMTDFKGPRYERYKNQGILTQNQIDYMDDIIKSFDETEAYTRGLNDAKIFNPAGTIDDIKASQISIAKFRKGTDKQIASLVNKELGDVGKGLEKSIKQQGKNLFQWDHVKSFMFGGTNTLDNLTPIHVKPHQLQPIPGKFLNVDEAMKMKTGFESNIWASYKKIINLVNEGTPKSIAKAEKISNNVKNMIDTAIKNKVPYKFVIDEPHGAFKIADKQSELKNLIDVYSNNPDKVRSLIHKVEYTPDFLKTNKTGSDRIIDELEGVYNRIAGLKSLGLSEDIIKEGVPYNRGGIVGINQLVRAL